MKGRNHTNEGTRTMTSNENTILITGGASGIGLELARAFHARGAAVIVAGRRKALIDEVAAAHPGITGYVLDVEDPAAIVAFAARVTADHPKLNVLINNAGVMVREDLATPAEALAIAEATVATNLLGPIRLTAALLPHLLARPKATVVNVTSGLAFVPLAATPTYSATKAAMHSYSQSLRHQLRDTAVEVIELAPPGVQTELMPGHAQDPSMMPLDEFMAQTMAQFDQDPAPAEVLVDRVLFLRNAEREGRFDQTFAALNGG
jgi:uncharacterized oxidoreductase